MNQTENQRIDEEEEICEEDEELEELETYEGFGEWEDGRDLELMHRDFIRQYSGWIHGVDVALHEPAPMRKSELQGLIEGMYTVLEDSDAVINPFFDQRDQAIHLLVISKRPLLDVMRALPGDAAYSAVSAFVSDEEEVAARTYLYMHLAHRLARTLTTY